MMRAAAKEAKVAVIWIPRLNSRAGHSAPARHNRIAVLTSKRQTPFDERLRFVTQACTE